MASERGDRWNPRGVRTVCNVPFHPCDERPRDAPVSLPAIDPDSAPENCDPDSAPENSDPDSAPNTVTDNMSQQEICVTIKMVSSFMSRNNIIENSIRKLAKKIYYEFKKQNYTLATRCLPTLLTMAGLTAPPGGNEVFHNLYEYLYQFFNIYIHDIETSNQRHCCIGRTECEEYCILPLYSNRFMSDRKISTLFRPLKYILAKKPFLLSASEETNEAQTAQNLLKYLVSTGCSQMQETYDVLYAMSGHCATIFDSSGRVDSQLYELIFDYLRSYDYNRVDIKPKSVPWLGTVMSDLLTREISQLEIAAYQRNGDRSISLVELYEILDSSSSRNESVSGPSIEAASVRTEEPTVDGPTVPQYRILRAVNELPPGRNASSNPNTPNIPWLNTNRRYTFPALNSNNEPSPSMSAPAPTQGPTLQRRQSSPGESAAPPGDEEAQEPGSPGSPPAPSYRILRAINTDERSDGSDYNRRNSGFRESGEFNARGGRSRNVGSNSYSHEVRMPELSQQPQEVDLLTEFRNKCRMLSIFSEPPPREEPPPAAAAPINQPEPESEAPPTPESPPMPQFRILRAVPTGDNNQNQQMPPNNQVTATAPNLPPNVEDTDDSVFTAGNPRSAGAYTRQIGRQTFRLSEGAHSRSRDPRSPSGPRIVVEDTDPGSPEAVPRYRILRAMPSTADDPPSYESVLNELSSMPVPPGRSRTRRHRSSVKDVDVVEAGDDDQLPTYEQAISGIF